MAHHTADKRAEKLLVQETVAARSLVGLKWRLQEHLKDPECCKRDHSRLKKYPQPGSFKREVFYRFAFIVPKPSAFGHCSRQDNGLVGA